MNSLPESAHSDTPDEGYEYAVLNSSPEGRVELTRLLKQGRSYDFRAFLLPLPPMTAADFCVSPETALPPEAYRGFIAGVPVPDMTTLHPDK